MIHVAILGAGHIAEAMAYTVHMLSQNSENDIQLYAVAARDLGRAQEFAKKYGIPKAFGCYEDMLNDPDVDLVYVATPHTFHYEHAMLCLDHGKYVLCEKPFAVNVGQAQEMLRCAIKKQLLIAEAIWTRYQPMREVIQTTLNSGIVGEPKMLTANLGYSMMHKARIVEPALAGGALLDVGIYPLNFAEMIFGHADQVVASCIKSPKGVDVADSITMTWKDGKMAVLNSAAHCVSDRYGVIYCTNGYIMVENINNPQGLRIYQTGYELVKEIRCPQQITGYEYEVLEAADCIRKGILECPSMPHNEILHMMELMDQIRSQMGIRYPVEL